MTIETILADLVAIPALPGRPDAEIVERVRAELAGHGVESTLITGPEGDRSNLFATIGPKDQPGYGDHGRDPRRTQRAGRTRGLTARASLASVSYGTEAGLFHAAGVPSIVRGPGSIAQAHRPGEYILRSEVDSSRAMLRGLGAVLSEG